VEDLGAPRKPWRAGASAFHKVGGIDIGICQKWGGAAAPAFQTKMPGSVGREPGNAHFVSSYATDS